jgi:TonB family protein
LAKNDEDRAIVDFNEAIRLDSHNATFLLSRATYHVRLANLNAAIADLNQAIALNPMLAAAYRIRGNVYRAERNFDHAIADYDQSLRIDRRDSRVLIDRALAYDAKGDNVQSDQDYQRVLVARLTIAKRYPHEARQRREEGLVRIAFSIDREGKVISTRVESSSGSSTLDEEALAMIDRAQPFPPLPDQSKDQARFIIPISFRLSPADREGI